MAKRYKTQTQHRQWHRTWSQYNFNNFAGGMFQLSLNPNLQRWSKPNMCYLLEKDKKNGLKGAVSRNCRPLFFS